MTNMNKPGSELATHIAKASFEFMRDRLIKNINSASLSFDSDAMAFTKALVRLYSSIKVMEGFVSKGVTAMGNINKESGVPSIIIDELKAIAKDEAADINASFDELSEMADHLNGAIGSC